MYALSKIRKDYINDKYLHCGAARNIGLAWKEASDVMGFELSQCCGKGYEIISRCLERLDIRVFKVL
jgi:ornithine carbamoyltransferase